MGRLVKLIGSGIGLATEAAAARKASNAQREQASQASSSSSSRSPPPVIDNDAPPQYVEVTDSEADKLIASGKAIPADSKSAHHEEDSETDADEEAWELDEALETTNTETDANTPEQTERQVVEAFLRSHPPPAYTERRGQLPCPVIIPQRRPRDKKRGFVRAYAPVLQECGIDQASFLDFLKSFHAASKASPWFQVINLAAAIVGFVPSVAAMAASTAVQIAVRVAMELQSRTRSSNFLDTLNKEYFQPRGLYCLIVTYKPESNATHESMDIMQAIQKSMNPATGMKGQLGKLKASSGKTYGEFEMPQSAPLIFPALDKLADDNTEEGAKKKSSIKSKSKFVTDYVDRRAQAKFAAENPGSSLAVPEQKFASRFSDPNHPVNSGSLISLVTGGAVNPRGLRGDRRVQRAVRRGQEVTPQTRQRRGGRQGIVRKMLRSDVLYMMIVNLPSEEETAATKRIFDEQGIQV